MRTTHILLFVAAALAVGCGSATTSTDSLSAENGGDPSTGGGDFAGGSSSGGATGPGASTGGGPTTSNGGGGQAGVLTAGMWDDNLNYDFFGKYLTTARQPGDPGFTTAEYDAAHAEFAQRSAHPTLDAALVIDTTGSMGDELAYLTAEFANITSAISAKFPGADQRWALVLYKDTVDADEYVVRTFDFTGDVSQFTANIGAQSAGGGGDYPESDEKGVGALTQLHWRTDPSVAHVAFWVGDAPHHTQDAAAMKKAITDAHGAGIHIYPVSASGTDSLLELTMRSAAQITGGRYMFLTDDSGVGDPHKQPEIPCYFVTKLESALVRAAAMEISGTNVAPDASEIIRTAGNPSAAGQCQLSDGQQVQAL
jgi:hypothetical protein